MSAPPDESSLLAEWERAREAIIPAIGERAEALYGWRLADALGSDDWRGRFAARLPGDDPADPQVTEAERLLLESASRGGEAVPDLEERMAEVFSDPLRAELAAYARLLGRLVRG